MIRSDHATVSRASCEITQGTATGEFTLTRSLGTSSKGQMRRESSHVGVHVGRAGSQAAGGPSSRGSLADRAVR